MDPVSELTARNSFDARSLSCVGWYHSHPTFVPHPSLRDLENQKRYQNLFETSYGIQPFIGVIVSPYDQENKRNESEFVVISVEDHHELLDSNEFQQQQPEEYKREKKDHSLYGHGDIYQFGIPYYCERSLLVSESLPQSLFDQVSNLVREYRHYEQYVCFSFFFK